VAADGPARRYPRGVLRTTSIEVLISGAVEAGGPLRLESDATLEAALRAAGGLAWRAGARPEGRVVVRRRRPSWRTIGGHRFALWCEGARDWRGVRLGHRDVLIVGWQLGPAPR